MTSLEENYAIMHIDPNYDMAEYLRKLKPKYMWDVKLQQKTKELNTLSRHLLDSPQDIYALICHYTAFNEFTKIRTRRKLRRILDRWSFLKHINELPGDYIIEHVHGETTNHYIDTADKFYTYVDEVRAAKKEYMDEKYDIKYTTIVVCNSSTDNRQFSNMKHYNHNKHQKHGKMKRSRQSFNAGR